MTQNVMKFLMTWLLIIQDGRQRITASIDVLRRLTDSLEIFEQVSHRWHKFLRLIGEPSSQPSLERKGAVDVRELTPLKRPKILPLEKPDLETGKDQLILKALRAVLRDDYA